MVSGIRATPAEVDRAAFANASISPMKALQRKTQDPMSISSNEMKGGNATLRSRRGRGRNGDGGNNRDEEESNKEGFLASDDAMDDFSRSVTKETPARILPLLTQRHSLTEIQPNVQVLPFASWSLKASRGDRTASNSQSQQEAEEDALAEETDVYPPPLTHLEFYQLPRVPNDRSEGRDDCILEFDLYQPIERAEDARWHGMEISDLRTHGLPTIFHDHTDLPETLDSASSLDQLPSMTRQTHHSKELYEEKTRARMSQFVPKRDTWSDDDVVYAGIHDVHELSQARSSVPSPLPAHSGFRSQRVVASTVALTTPEWMRSAQFSHPLCSFCPQHLNLQNHQLVHQSPLQNHWMSNCLGQLVCAVGDSPQQHHWVPYHHGQLSQHFPLQVIDRTVRQEQEQLSDSKVSIRNTKNRISKRQPPFPSQGAAPYVLCQHCAQLLQAPACSPPTHAVTLKLRCGSCWRVSKFGILQQRMPHMSTPSYADGSECSCEASFRFSAPEHVSTVRSGLGEETNSHVHEVSRIWSTCFAGDFSPFCERRPFGNTGPFETNAGALSNTLTPSDDNAEIPGRESTFSSTTVAGADTHNTVELTHRDSTDGEEAGVLESSSSVLQSGTVSSDEQGNRNCVSSRNDFQQQDAQVRSSSTNDPQRNQAEKEDCPLSCDETVLANSDRPGSPLYKLLGYNSPTDLQQRCPSNGPRDDAFYSARVSDASNSTIEKLTFPRSTPDSEEKMSCNHLRTSESSGTCAECDLEREWYVDTAHNDDNLYSVSRSPIVATNALVEPQLAAVKPSTGFFKRSLKGLADRGANFSGNFRQKVIVNGVVLSSAAIKKAEERAGKLRPGCYWYDRKAGFWGVSGGPCVGILPPFIEDFHPSMARECSNGTTKVVVNGRELCQEDLNKLVRRGLSGETRKVYSVLHDGTVIDETSGQKLKSLGKLAPTVERRGKGFGMFMAPSRTT